MDGIRPLILPESYEALAAELRNDFAKMSQFVVPVEDAEKHLAVIAESISSSGKMVFLVGIPGVGKSTFIQSLTWRRHLPIPEITEVDAHELFGDSEKPLVSLYQRLQQIAIERARDNRPGAVITIVINYLENLAGQEDSDIRAFFRNVNGLLRRHAILIIWPLTEHKEADLLLQYASAVSGTVFSDEPVLQFSGPPVSEFPRIAKDTISTLNPGLAFDDFLLSDDELSLMLKELKQQSSLHRTIRDYLKAVKKQWQAKSGELQAILDRIPRPTEIWFVVCYPEAESVVSQFARKSPYAPDDTWDADYRCLSQYIVANTQNAADWNPKRLQFALRGVFRTKILFIPTNAIVSCIAAYGPQNSVREELLRIIREGAIDTWSRPVSSRRFLQSSPMMRQLLGEPATLGKRRSGSSALSIKKAGPLFEAISSYARDVSDQPLNGCLAQSLREICQVDEEVISSEADHPFLDGIRPDILIKRDPNKLICVEMFYTISTTPSTLANYILAKLNRYMKQLEYYNDKPKLFLNDY